jgi:pSer/pThr/pTyr-binding forkhead associated (FHA) protein
MAAGELSIGRDRSNTICLEDLAVSRRHALIAPDGPDFRITDLGSHNRTAVNGVPVENRVLKNGDQIRIGHSVFVVGLEDGTTTTIATESLLVDDAPASEHTVILQHGDALYLDPDRVVDACA